MEIGTKIKNARNDSKLTQEQVAEALGVSRQTISNWENEKSYPDIINVIKMSDLYSITLDHLLKEEIKVNQTYIDYLEERTNLVKAKNKLAKNILIATYLIIWTVTQVMLWFFVPMSNAVEFSKLFLWGLLLVTTFIISLMIGKNNYWEKRKWWFSFLFGIMFTLVPYTKFNIELNYTVSYLFIWPNLWALPIVITISLVGIGMGAFLHKIQQQK